MNRQTNTMRVSMCEGINEKAPNRSRGLRNYAVLVSVMPLVQG